MRLVYSTSIPDSCCVIILKNLRESNGENVNLCNHNNSAFCDHLYMPNCIYMTKRRNNELHAQQSEHDEQPNSIRTSLGAFTIN